MADIIRLHQYPRGPGRLPNASPFCMKLEGYLRLSGRPFEVVTSGNPKRGPKGQMPFISLGGRRIGDSGLIVAELEATAAEPVDGWLDDGQRAVSALLTRTFEEHFLWAVIYARWLDPAASPRWGRLLAGLTGLPYAVVPPMLPVARRLIRRRLHSQGTGRHSAAEIYALAAPDLAAAAAILGDKPFLFGGRLAVADLVLAAFIGGVLEMPWTGELDRAIARHPALAAHFERVLETVYGGLPSAE